MIDALESATGTSPVLKLFTGAPPANCATANSGTELVSMTLASDWLGNAADGVKAKAGTWAGTAVAGGTAGHFRLYASDGVTCHMQGLVATTGADLNLTVGSFVSGQPVSVASFYLAAIEPTITLASPTYSETFTYTDGTRLVAGDPNANWGGGATNPGNLGWDALTTGGANIARFNPVIQSGKVVERSASQWGEGDSYVLAPAGTTLSGNHYVKAGLQTVTGGVNRSMIATLAQTQTNRLELQNDDRIRIQIEQVVAGSRTSLLSATGGSNARKLGGPHGNFKLPDRSDDQFSLIVFGANAYVRRGPGFPIGNSTPSYSFAFSDPGGNRFGLATRNNYLNGISDLEAGALTCLLFHNDTHNNWYPRKRASSSATIFDGGNATITFTGTYLGTAPSRLQWALADIEDGTIVKDWAWAAIADTTIGGGNWSVTLTVPWGLNGRKAYAIGVRAVGADNLAQPGTAVFSNRQFYVSINIGLVGQSNSGGLTNLRTAGNYVDFPGATRYAKADPPSLVKGTFDDLTSYFEGVADTDALDYIGAGMGDALSAYFGGPVAFEGMAIGARGADALGPLSADWDYIQTHHAHAGAAYEIIYLDQGENELTASGNLWESQWITNLAEYRAQYMHGQPSGTVIPVFVGWTGRGTGGSDTSGQQLRLGQVGILSQPNVIAGVHKVGIKYHADNVHYSSSFNETGYAEVGRRIALSIKKYYSGTGYDGMGPSFATVTRSGSALTLPVTLNGASSTEARNGTDQSSTATASALTSWQVNSAADFTGTSYTVTSTALASNNVTLNLGSSPAGPVYVRNHYGVAPDITSWVFGAYGDGTYIGAKPIITPLLSN